MGHADHDAEFVVQQLEGLVDQSEIIEHRIQHPVALQHDDPGVIAHQEADHK